MEALVVLALMSSNDLCKVMGWRSPQTARRLRVLGGGPPFLKRGRKVLYDPRDVQKWIDGQKRTSTSDLGMGRGK